MEGFAERSFRMNPVQWLMCNRKRHRSPHRYIIT
jgi:hypothetical protein